MSYIQDLNPVDTVLIAHISAYKTNPKLHNWDPERNRMITISVEIQCTEIMH